VKLAPAANDLRAPVKWRILASVGGG